MSGGIFISYRRDDAAGYAGRLYDRLAEHFGRSRVFMDVEGIEPGTDFVDAIERAVGACEILIVIIGHDWLAAGAGGKRRIDDPSDFVRLETASALKRSIRVVPVLVEDTPMPRADQLPPDLAPLARRQAVELNHRQWDATSGELISTLERILGRDHVGPAITQGETASAATPGVAAVSRPRRVWVAGGAIGAVALAVAAYVWHPWSDTQEPALLQVTPASLRFSEAPIESAAPKAIVQLRNDGPGALHVQGLSVDGPNASEFTLGDDQCTGRELAPGAQCTVNVGFRPRAAGARDASLAIAHDGKSAPAKVALQGVGTPAVVAVAKPPADVKPPAEAKPPAETKPPADTKPPPEARPAETKPPAEAKPPLEPPARPPAKERPEVAMAKPRILHFESRVDGAQVRLCYGVENAASATITPRPGNVRPVAKECVALPASAPTGTYTLEARNAEGASVAQRLDVQPPPPPVAMVSVPNAVGMTRKQAQAEIDKAGLVSRIVEDKGESTATPDSVVAQAPRAGESVQPGAQVTLRVAIAAPARVALPTKLPRVGDRWQYRATSIWKNVEPRTYVHQVTDVSEREVRETMMVANGEGPGVSKSFGAKSRYVEWRGTGYYVVEFNPFLQAFDEVQPGTEWKPLETPNADPFYTNWYGRGRAVGWDTITVPAGSFKALRIELDSSRKSTASMAMQAAEPVRIVHVAWYAPDVKRTVKQVHTVYAASGRKLDEDTFELVKYGLQ